MTKKIHDTPLLDELKSGPWPSFVEGLERLATDEEKPGADMMKDLLGQLEHSYEERRGFWKGGTVSVFGYGGGVIPRFSEVAKDYPESSEFHTLRIIPPAGMHYSTKLLRDMCDIWEEHGSGLIALHGQSGDIMFQGCTTDSVQPAFDALNEIGLDMGGAGPALRTSMNCVGSARCEQSCYDEVRTHRMIINGLCVNAIHRADMAVIGTWRDDMQVDQERIKEHVANVGRKQMIDTVIAMCPTRALSLNDDDTLDIDNKSCVRCMHCINVMPKALSPGKDRGVTILMGGKRSLKIGDQLGTVIHPFLKLDTDEDYETLMEFAEDCVDFFAENALEHERIGETIDRIGLANFLDALDVPVDPNMVNHPRTSSYVRTDDWDVEAAKWFEHKKATAK